MPKASASAQAQKAVARCTEVKPGARFTIGERGNKAAETEADDIEVAQPFAVEVGSAVALESGFAVSALRNQGGGTGAVIAIVGEDAAQGKLIDLGRIHGDVEPPQLAHRDNDLFVAVSDNDAGGPTLRLAVVRDLRGERRVQWGGELTQGRDESLAFGIEVAGPRGALVWDEIDKNDRRGIIRLATFDAAQPGTLTVARTVSPTDRDAEVPEIVRRPGGYWLAYVATRPRAAAPDPRRASAPGGKRDAGAPAPAEADLGRPEPLLEVGQRFIELVPLDGNGSPTSSPIALTPRDRHVLVYDLAPGPSGSALLAWRDDDTSPGAESRTVHLAQVRPDGSIDAHVLEDEAVGAGVPSLLVDGDKPSWLALESVSDETRLVALGPSGAARGALLPEPAIRSGELLAVRAGTLLVMRPSGMAASLSAVACRH